MLLGVTNGVSVNVGGGGSGSPTKAIVKLHLMFEVGVGVLVGVTLSVTIGVTGGGGVTRAILKIQWYTGLGVGVAVGVLDTEGVIGTCVVLIVKTHSGGGGGSGVGVTAGTLIAMLKAQNLTGLGGGVT